jgi:hypothetical protein
MASTSIAGSDRTGQKARTSARESLPAAGSSVNRIQFDGSAVQVDETVISVRKQAKINARQRFMVTLLLE